MLDHHGWAGDPWIHIPKRKGLFVSHRSRFLQQILIQSNWIDVGMGKGISCSPTTFPCIKHPLGSIGSPLHFAGLLKCCSWTMPSVLVARRLQGRASKMRLRGQANPVGRESYSHSVTPSDVKAKLALLLNGDQAEMLAFLQGPSNIEDSIDDSMLRGFPDILSSKSFTCSSLQIVGLSKTIQC